MRIIGFLDSRIIVVLLPLVSSWGCPLPTKKPKPGFVSLLFLFLWSKAGAAHHRAPSFADNSSSKVVVIRATAIIAIVLTTVITLVRVIIGIVIIVLVP